MKKLILSLCILLGGIAAGAQGLLDRFSEPGAEKTVFISKGNRAMGIAGAYRGFSAGGEDVTAGDGFAILSYLNIGNGALKMYNVSPSFSVFVADDLSLDFRLDYSGYHVDTDLKLDLRSIDFLNTIFEEKANVQIASRHMLRNSWGASMALRKYMSFFGSKTFGVFGEARLFGNLGNFHSCPIVDVVETRTRTNEKGEVETYEVRTGETRYATEKMRNSQAWSAGLKVAGGLAVKLRDNSAVTVSVPLVGVAYNYTRQDKVATNNNAHMSQFTVARNVDLIGIQVGYVRYIAPKKK